jgi:hypothetical protein
VKVYRAFVVEDRSVEFESMVSYRWKNKSDDNGSKRKEEKLLEDLRISGRKRAGGV